MNEEMGIIQFLRSGATEVLLKDDLHVRLVNVFNDPNASALDRAVLVRQLLRRWSLRDGREVPVELDDAFESCIRKESKTVGLRVTSDRMWVANPWTPEWLQCDGGTPDAAALAGTPPGVRFQADPLLSDPFFEGITGYDTYKTPGQRAACRAVMTAPEGATVVSVLPTGSGKTEIALCLAKRAARGLTVIVVPTVALAYDFERRFREHYGRQLGGRRKVDPAALNFAWTANTTEADRQNLKRSIADGYQPILVTSPESMTRTLRQTLLDVAGTGRLTGFVVDEAHLVTQWGRGFRPEFRMLADLRRDLLRNAESGGYSRAITLLLSATVGAVELEDLTALFGEPGPCSLVIANTLRSEPDLWIATADDAEERNRRVRETLAHCARPVVLYVTSPEAAVKWATALRQAGYSRLATVTGDSTALERARVLEGIRADPGDADAVDLVVATSAFGLGIDYAHIRTVVHACLPETIDRWYQELGRGGRDGDACAAFLLTGPGDDSEARSLGVKVLTPEKAEKRWYDLWDHRRLVNGRTFLDLEDSWGPHPGSYNHRWNAQLIQGLVELGELEREQFDSEDIRELTTRDSAGMSDWTAVRRTGTRLGMSDFWQEVWLPWQQQESRRSGRDLKRIREVSRLRVGACRGIAGSYAPTDELRIKWGRQVAFMEPVAPCGRCPDCRHRGMPVDYCPPPEPDQAWAVGNSDHSELTAFAVAARGVNGLALLVYEPTDERELVAAVTGGLARIGVAHVGGVQRELVDRSDGIIFVDELPLSPVSLTPVSSFSYFAAYQTISRHWLSRRVQSRVTLDGAQLVDVLLVPAGSVIGRQVVGRDIPSLHVATANELLKRG